MAFKTKTGANSVYEENTLEQAIRMGFSVIEDNNKIVMQGHGKRFFAYRGNARADAVASVLFDYEEWLRNDKNKH